MPARTTPMMLVQVYSETPMYGARMRPATSSRMSVQALETKTIKYATGRDIPSGGQGSIGPYLRSSKLRPSRLPAVLMTSAALALINIGLAILIVVAIGTQPTGVAAMGGL